MSNSEIDESESNEIDLANDGPCGVQEGEFALQSGARKFFRFSLREALGLMTIAILAVGLWSTSMKLRNQENELRVMRQEFGYLAPSRSDQIASSRIPSDQPLTYKMRVRLPRELPGGLSYQLVYSSLWESGKTFPAWFGSVPVPQGESLVTIQILNDPRDGKWKIAAVVSATEGTSRIATGLPPPHEVIFRGSHDVISTGLGRETSLVSVGETIRLLDERWVVGNQGVMLDGGPPREDLVGVFAQLEPTGTP
jgi:hypothetical protein